MDECVHRHRCAHVQLAGGGAVVVGCCGWGWGCGSGVGSSARGGGWPSISFVSSKASPPSQLASFMPSSLLPSTDVLRTGRRRGATRPTHARIHGLQMR